ncbi:MAG: methyltransferase domain-containing protein [Treponema sp.]|nr:methyltransferase domain-containing protein [Treponema sp.]
MAADNNIPDNNINEKSRLLWDAIANDWDTKMGIDGNAYHREIIRPATLKLLNPQRGEVILDVCCGSGHFAAFLAGLGVRVTAFDYSPKMIALARERFKDCLEKIDFKIADATKYDELMLLKPGAGFDKAVSNMAVMDISDAEPMFRAVHDLLLPGGVFVFSSVHPCFQTPNMGKFAETNDYTGDLKEYTGIKTTEYIKPKTHETLVLAHNEKHALHFHRPLSVLLRMCFDAGFIMDGIEEPVFNRPQNYYPAEKSGVPSASNKLGVPQSGGPARFEWYEIPPSIIIRLKKITN